MGRCSFKMAKRPHVDANATCRLLTLPVELRQRIYDHAFHDVVIVRSYINAQRHSPPVGVCEYPSHEEVSLDWLDSNEACRDLLFTCKAIYHDALVSYISISTLCISVCQLAKAPPGSQYLLNVRHLDIGEPLDHHMGESTMKEAVSSLQQFLGLKSVRLNRFEFADYDKHEEYFGPNNEGLKEAILADGVWGVLIGGIVRKLPEVRLSFETKGCATLEDLINRIGHRKPPGPRTAAWVAASKLKLGTIRGDIESLAAKVNIEPSDEIRSGEGTDSESNDLTDGGDEDDENDDSDDEDDEPFNDIYLNCVVKNGEWTIMDSAHTNLDEYVPGWSV